MRKPQKPAARVMPSKIKGFADLGRSDDESEEDESNEYYTGGEKSGMVRMLMFCIFLVCAAFT